MKNKWRNGVTGCLVYWGEKYDFVYSVVDRNLQYNEVNRKGTLKTEHNIDFSEVQDLLEKLEK